MIKKVRNKSQQTKGFIYYMPVIFYAHVVEKLGNRKTMYNAC